MHLGDFKNSTKVYVLWVLHGWHRCKAKCVLKRFDKDERNLSTKRESKRGRSYTR